MAKAIPEHNIRVGNIQVAIWANETDKGTRQSITIDKSYKSGDEWKRTKSFSPNDLAKVQLAINKTLEYLYCKTVISPEKETENDV